MKLKFTRKTWYFLLLASAAASMLNGFAVLSGTSFGLIEQIAFAAAGIAALFLAAEKEWKCGGFAGGNGNRSSASRSAAGKGGWTAGRNADRNTGKAHSAGACAEDS